MKRIEQCVLFLTREKDNEKSIKAFYNIKKNLDQFCDCFLLIHTDNDISFSNEKEIMEFSYKSLACLGYKPLFETLIPGSNHFPVFQFFKVNSSYKFYWLIEDDVFFNGDWSLLINTYSTFDFDFISSHINVYSEDPDWAWWSYFFSTGRVFSLQERTRSFNPIYRLSNKALFYLDTMFKEGYAGHHEVSIATLLKDGNFKIHDFGENSNFKDNPKKIFYIVEHQNDFKTISGSLRWRPQITEDDIKYKNILYHPVKYK